MKILFNPKAHGLKIIAMSALCLMVSFFAPPPVVGQNGCLDMADNPNYLAGLSQTKLLDNDGPYTLRLYIYNVKHTDGTGGLPQSTIKEVISRLEKDFSPHNIYFSIACIDDIENSFYKEEPDLLLNSSYVNSNGINLFVSNSTSFSGFAEDFGSNAAYAFFNEDISLPSHEIGHCLGLYHTFHGSPCAGDGGTLNDPNNCTNTGDFICETEPAPWTADGLQADCTWDPTTTCNGVLYPNADPKNLMSYGGLCREYFVNEQGAYMRNMIENHPALTPTQVNERYVFSSVTWGNDQTIDTDIRVFGPATLNIKSCTLSMAPGRRIIVEKGAYLVIKDAVITLDPTSACLESGDFWRGIELRGGTNSEKPSYVAVHNSTIELAETVLYYPSQITSSSYGRVIASDAVFQNNRNAVNFISSGPQASYYNLTFPTRFIRCQFKIDQNYPASAFDTHAILAFARNISFEGCTFENDLYQQFGQNETNFAIWSLDSELNVKAWCNLGYPPDNCPETQYTPTTIKDFNTGIQVIDSDGFIVRESIFENIATGINAEGSNSFTIVDNQFNLDDFPGANELVGLLNDGGTSFSIYGNNFSSETENTTNFGIFVRSTGEEPNEIRNNTFEDMRRGIWVVGQNQNSFLPSIGLSMVCNNQVNNITGNSFGPYDFRVIFGSTIASIQGAPDNPAGNTFSLNTFPSGSDYRIETFGPPSVDYFYKDNAPSQEPLNIAGISKFDSDDEPVCQIEGGVLTETDYTDLNDHYLTHINNFNTIKQTYDQLIDRGNTQALVNTVNSASTPFEANAIKNDLLGLAPFVSKEVLVAVHERSDLFTDQTRYDILSANPDALKTTAVADVIETSSQQLSEPYRSQLIAGNFPITTRTTMESDLAQNKMAAHRAINRALELLSEDTLSTPSQERGWLAKKESFEGSLEIAGNYFREGNLDSMTNYLSSIPVQLPLTPTQTAIHQDYSAYLLTLKDVLQANRNFFELDSTELATLNNIALAGGARPNLAAREFLRIYYNYQFPPSSLAAPEQHLNPTASVPPFETTEVIHDEFSIAPNPAKDQITIRFTEVMPGASQRIKVRYLTGQLIADIPLKAGQSSLEWNSSMLAEGVYLISLDSGNRVPITKKVFIVR